MGTFYEQMVIVTTDEAPDELDAFMVEHPDYFARSAPLSNGTINYVMFWDGSKEGWDSSNEADELRKEFLILCNKLRRANIYEINNHESWNPDLQVTRVRNYTKPSRDTHDSRSQEEP